MRRRRGSWLAVTLLLPLILSSSPFSAVEGFAPVPQRAGSPRRLAFVEPSADRQRVSKRANEPQGAGSSDRRQLRSRHRLRAGAFAPPPAAAVMVIY
jgi:hypothetical protein